MARQWRTRESSVARNAFHEVIFHNRRFVGLLCNDGPYLECEPGFGGVALGSCTSLRKFAPEPPDRSDFGWYIVKNGKEPRIGLSQFSDDEALALAREFGIPLFEPAEGQATPDFFESQAIKGLARWMRANPASARNYRESDRFLPGWFEKASKVRLPAAGAVVDQVAPTDAASGSA
jgi:hypothetical protein